MPRIISGAQIWSLAATVRALRFLENIVLSRAGLFRWVVFVNAVKWLLAIVCLSASAQAQTNEPIMPAKFLFSSGGMIGGQSISLNGRSLKYEQTKFGVVVTNRTVTPTDKQWREFWAAAERLQLFQWKPYYVNKHIADGWFWKIEIERGKTQFKSFGRNAVPADADVTKQNEDGLPNKRFTEFKSALETLLGFKLW